MSVSAHRILNVIRDADHALNDPGAGGRIEVSGDLQVCELVTLAAESRTLDDPTKAGIRLVIRMKTDGGDCTVTAVNGLNADGDTQAVFANVGDQLELISVSHTTGYRWDILVNTGPAALLGGAAGPTLITDIIAYYRFNSSGEDTVNGRDLTVESGTFVDGKINGALQEGFAEAATVVQTTGEVTISMWINIGIDAEDTAAAGQVQVTDGLNLIRLTQSSRNGSAIVAEFRVSDGSTEQFVENADVSVTSDTEWLHVVGVMPVDGQMYLYVNGVYNNASVVPFPFEISSIQVNSTPDAVSKVGDVGIWNRALTQSEVTQLYNSGNGLDPTA